MIVGFCGAGSMAGAMARGWQGEVDSMLFTDGGSGRAAELAREVDGEAVKSNTDLVDRAELVVLAIKPSQLEAVAPELQGAKAVVSLLGATSFQQLTDRFPDAQVTRVMPNIAVEVNQGVLCVTGAKPPEMMKLLEKLGHVVELADFEFDAATAMMGCAPAYLALAVEAIADAGAETELGAQQALDLVERTAIGTTALLRKRSPKYVREAVASPGGSTEAGLDELEKAEVRAAFKAAVDASLKRMGATSPTTSTRSSSSTSS
jgi:pyrroline-5-carboxylate reductase